MSEQNLKYLFLQEFRSAETNPVVFNRFSTTFASQSYHNSPFNTMARNEYNPMTQVINIRELLDDVKGYSPPNSSV